MDEGRFDRWARRVGATSSRRVVVGGGLAVVGVALAAGGPVGLDGAASATTTRRWKPGRPPRCIQLAEECSATAECCSASICSQNGAAIPDRPRCCRGIGLGCLFM
jgi:hypothetical protein